MTDRQGIEQELRSMIATRMPDQPDPASISLDVPIFDKGLGLDSMTGIELLAAIEEHFKVYIDDDDFDVFDSLRRLVDFVAEHARGN